MIRVDMTEFQRDVERYHDLALAQPVTIAEPGSDEVIMISAKEYHRLKRRDREVLGREDFTEADLEAIERAEVSAEAAAFDHELNS